MKLTDPQPEPKNEGEAIVPLVINDLQERREFGRKKYGDELRTESGRNALIDAYQEALDQVIYLRQRIEQDQKEKKIFVALESYMNGTVTLNVSVMLIEARSWEMAFEKMKKLPNWNLVEGIVQEADSVSYYIGKDVFGCLRKEPKEII